MTRLPVVMGLCALATALAVGSGYSQDKKEDKAGAKGTLPAGWCKLWLTADQKKKITSIRGSYSAKIDDLKKQIDQLKEGDISECLKVLTDDQKMLLKKLATDKIDGKDKDKSDKDGDKKKGNETGAISPPILTVTRRQED
jgi:hypothetical protein